MRLGFKLQNLLCLKVSMKTNTENQNLRSSSTPRFRQIMQWLIVGGASILGFTSISTVLITLFRDGGLSDNGWIVVIAREHFAAVVGLPAAAVASMCIVLFLEYSTGPIEFEGLGFKFRGAAGPVVLWVFCFIAITIAIKVLW